MRFIYGRHCHRLWGFRLRFKSETKFIIQVISNALFFRMFYSFDAIYSRAHIVSIWCLIYFCGFFQLNWQTNPVRKYRYLFCWWFELIFVWLVCLYSSKSMFLLRVRIEWLIWKCFQMNAFPNDIDVLIWRVCENFQVFFSSNVYSLINSKQFIPNQILFNT